MAARGRARSVVGVCPALGWERGNATERQTARFFRRTQWLVHHFSTLLPFVARHPTLRRIALRDVVADGRGVSADDALAMFNGSKGCTIVSEVLDLVGTNEALDLGPINCPVRILYGTKDRILRWPQHYTRMRRLLPDAEWVALAGLGHVPMWDAPSEVADAILAHTT
jgi:pimeloyl-ACP methyl ester carboxylesterase